MTCALFKTMRNVCGHVLFRISVGLGSSRLWSIVARQSRYKCRTFAMYRHDVSLPIPSGHDTELSFKRRIQTITDVRGRCLILFGGTEHCFAWHAIDCRYPYLADSQHSYPLPTPMRAFLFIANFGRHFLSSAITTGLCIHTYTHPFGGFRSRKIDSSVVDTVFDK